MLKSLSHQFGKGTQTRLSAFFCLHLVAVLLAAASSAHAYGFEDKKPAIHLEGVSIERIDWNKRVAATKLAIAIDNPGPALKLKDLRYRLKLNDEQAAEGKYEREITLPANSTATFDLPCDVDLSKLPAVTWGFVAGGFDVHYELEMEFNVPLFLMVSPRIKTSIAGDLSLATTVSGWTARIKERLSTNH